VFVDLSEEGREVCVEQMEKEENAKKTLGQPEAFTHYLPFHSSYLFY
jgi:hypothetical protein